MMAKIQTVNIVVVMYVKFDDDPQEPSQEEMDKHAKKESAPFGEPSQQEEAYEDLMNALQSGGEEAYAKACGLSPEELDQEMSEIARERNLHMDDDRDEIIHAHAEETCDNMDVKQHEDIDMGTDLDDLRRRAGLDVEEGKLPAGLQAYQDKKNGKKDDADEDEDKDEVDEALNELRRRAGL